MRKFLLAAMAIFFMVGLSRAIDGIANVGGRLKVIDGNNSTDLTAPVTLLNGTKVLPDGTMIPRIGPKKKLSVGDAIDWRGLHSFYGLPLVVNPLNHIITVNGLRNLSSLLSGQPSDPTPAKNQAKKGK